jgi:Flp pilus assembly pilin Flp
MEKTNMKRILRSLWRDDTGALLTVEWVFMATILVIGLVAGLKAVQSAVLNELEEIAGAIGGLSQSYSFGGTSGCCAFTAGSQFTDTTNTYPITTCSPRFDEPGAPCPD